MIIEVEIGVQQPEKVDTDKVAAILPYGQGAVRAVHGGLDVPKLMAALPLSPMRRRWFISILSLQEPHNETHHPRNGYRQ